MTSTIPDFPAFAKLSCDHKDELRLAFEKYPPGISEFTTGFLFGYAENFKHEVTRLNGNICIFGDIHYQPSFFPPIGNGKTAETVESCLRFLGERFGRGRINAAPGSMAALFRNDKRYRVTDDRDNYDYVYRVADLANLSGSKYQAKRNFVKQFEKRYACEYREITPDILAQCRELQERWCDLKNCATDVSLSFENRFVYTMLNNFEACKLFGAALMIDGKVQAFTIAEKMNENTAAIHAEKANTAYRGIYQAINNLFCRRGLEGFTYVNREQDVGDPGLRKAKLSYYPDHLVEKFNIERV